MFADDTFSAKSGFDLNDLISEVNDETNKMAVWFRANKLAVNINRTKYMIFRMRGKKIEENQNELDSPIDNSLISVIERYHDDHQQKEGRSYKLLGIFLDEHL
jgi:hypothetical protein